MRTLPLALALATVATTAPLLAADSARDDVTEKTLAAIAALDERGQKIANTYLKDRVAGKPVACVSQPRLRRSTAASDEVLLYDAGTTVYVNAPYLGCPGARGNAMISRSPMTRFCAGDTIVVEDLVARVPLGSCALNEFVPFHKVKPTD